MRPRLGPSDEDGAAAVEFAIIAPLLFLLIFGIIQFGIFFAQDLALSNAARQAARAAAVPSTGDCASIFNEVRQGAVTIALNTDPNVNPDFRMDVVTPGAGTPCNEVPFSSPPPPLPPLALPYDSTEVPCEGEAPGSEVTVIVKAKGRIAIPLFGDLGEIDLEREGNYRCEFS